MADQEDQDFFSRQTTGDLAAWGLVTALAASWGSVIALGILFSVSPRLARSGLGALVGIAGAVTGGIGGLYVSTKIWPPIGATTTVPQLPAAAPNPSLAPASSSSSS